MVWQTTKINLQGACCLRTILCLVFIERSHLTFAVSWTELLDLGWRYRIMRSVVSTK